MGPGGGGCCLVVLAFVFGVAFFLVVVRVCGF